MQRTTLQIALAAGITTAALLGATAAQASSSYVGLAVGQSDYKLDTAGTTSADTKDTGFKLFVGTRFTEHLGIEAALFDLGSARGSANVPGFGAVSVTGKARGVSLAGRAVMPISGAELFAKLGLAYVRAEIDANSPFGAASERKSSVQPTFGVGAAYAFSAQWSARVEWERVRVRYLDDLKENTDLLSIGVAYRF